jgi:hypothetical protein
LSGFILLGLTLSYKIPPIPPQTETQKRPAPRLLHDRRNNGDNGCRCQPPKGQIHHPLSGLLIGGNADFEFLGFLGQLLNSLTVAFNGLTVALYEGFNAV